MEARQNFYAMVHEKHGADLKLRPGYTQSSWMTEIQNDIDKDMLKLPLNPSSPFSCAIHAPVRKSHQLPQNHVIHQVISTILGIKQWEQIPDVFRELHRYGAKCLFQPTYDLDMEYPDTQIIYLHIIDNDVDCFDRYIHVLFEAFDLPKPLHDLNRVDQLLMKHKPDKHDLQNAVKCYNPLQSGEPEQKSRTKWMTKSLAWLKWYFHPHVIDRFSVDNIQYFEYLGTILEKLSLQKWQEYLLFIWLNHVSAWFSDTYRLYHHLDRIIGDLPMTGVRDSETLDRRETLESSLQTLESSLQTLESSLHSREMLEYKFPTLKVHKLNISQEAWWQSSSLDFLAFDYEHLVKGRKMAESMTQVMKDVLYDIFEKSQWERSTKSEAQMKLKNMVCNIGWSDVAFEPFPKFSETWHFDDMILVGWQYQYDVIMKKANQKVNKKEWRFISYNIVNACYSRELNTLYIPASLFYEPFLYLDEEKLPETFASLGSIIAHELYHGFDYDSKDVNYLSMLSNWWSKKDHRQFLKDSETTIHLYSRKNVISSGYRDTDYYKKSKRKTTVKQHTKMKHYKINGRLTLSENIADIVALHISYDAFVKWWETHFVIHPGSAEQKRFFHAFALSQIQIYTQSGVESALKEDVHAIAAARVNLPLSIFPPFLNLYQVKSGDPMYTPCKLRPQFFFDQKS